MRSARAANSGRAMALAGSATTSGMTKSVTSMVKLGAASVFSIFHNGVATELGSSKGK